MNDDTQTPKQAAFVQTLKRKVHVSDRVLDSYCERRFGAPVASLNRSTTSDLIDTMLGWDTLPADLQRDMGQLDMFAHQEIDHDR